MPAEADAKIAAMIQSRGLDFGPTITHGANRADFPIGRFANFSEIYVEALKALHGQIAAVSRPVGAGSTRSEEP
jgi:hypothetical protein